MEIVLKIAFLLAPAAMILLLGCRPEMKPHASTPDMTILCDPHPVEANGWIPAYDKGCLDKRWLCDHASYASYLRDMVKTEPLVNTAIDEEDLVVVSTLQSMYAFLLLN